jgi:HK97 family phage prohead protease
MEQKAIRLDHAEFKLDEEERTFSGYAAAFGNVDSYGDIIERGAFAKTISEDRKRIKVGYNHGKLIGLPTEMREDERGLYIKAKIAKTATGDEILQLMREGVLTEMSIGYVPVKWEYREDASNRVRVLKEIKLMEFGPVDFAANPEATITAVKDEARALRAAIAQLKSIGAEPVEATPQVSEPVEATHDADLLAWVQKMGKQ